MNEDLLINRAREYEAAVHAQAEKLSMPFPAALRAAAERLVPDTWHWRIEEVYGGRAIFFITEYTGT